jgi:hypothetical protein
MSSWNRNKVIDIELPVHEALDKIICSAIEISKFVEHHGEEEILGHISDSALEEEYLRRSPLGRALNEL